MRARPAGLGAGTGGSQGPRAQGSALRQARRGSLWHFDNLSRPCPGGEDWEAMAAALMASSHPHLQGGGTGGCEEVLEAP